MLGIAIGHRVARTGRTGPEGRPAVTVTDLAGTDGVADPAAALALLLAGAAGEGAGATGRQAGAPDDEVVLGWRGETKLMPTAKKSVARRLPRTPLCKPSTKELPTRRRLSSA